MAVEVEGLDVELLRSEIQRTYAAVSSEPDRDFMFPTGRAWAQDLGYPADLLARVPETSCESFAGVANPFSLGRLASARMCSTSAAARAGLAYRSADGRPDRPVTGIDMTPEMIAKARRSVAEIGLDT